MSYAKQLPDGTFALCDLSILFPHTSFAGGVPPDEFLRENGIFKTADAVQEVDEAMEIVVTKPYLSNGVVYLHEVVPLRLDKAKERKKAEFYDKCGIAIVAGFVSSALGSKHVYPCKDKDQNNLNAAVTASLIPGLPSDYTIPFWCADEDGDWEMRPHTIDQIRSVGMDGVIHVQTNQTINESLSRLVEGAETLEEVLAIVWPEQSTALED
jgi:hypothetical protein